MRREKDFSDRTVPIWERIQYCHARSEIRAVAICRRTVASSQLGFDVTKKSFLKQCGTQERIKQL